MTHLDFETLAAYQLGELGEADEAAAEEHLFACDACTGAAERLAAVCGALRSLLPPVMSARRLERLAHETTLVISRAIAGTPISVVFQPGAQLHVISLSAAPEPGVRLDCELVALDDRPLAHFEDVPFDAAAGAAHLACQRHYVEGGGFPAELRARLVEVREGSRRIVGEFELRHVFL